ncbi:hypothetical protein IWW34DRAFT_441441 [Fusarium oxysporum f. sp. albedinis]|nr:hypothetical protein IWW34DRAFT_441441 [Fusarium oxysporum f. sp. albedinis]
MQERQVTLRGLASSSISGDHVTIYGQQTNEAWVSFAPHLIPREDPLSCSRPRYLQTPPFTCKAYRSPRDSMVIRNHQRVGFASMPIRHCVRKEERTRGDTATTPDESNHGAGDTKAWTAAVQSANEMPLGGTHREREEKRRAFRRGYHHRSICSDQVAYTEGRVGWRGARSRLVFAYLLHSPGQTPDRRAKREKDLHIRLTEVGLARN